MMLDNTYYLKDKEGNILVTRKHIRHIQSEIIEQGLFAGDKADNVYYLTSEMLKTKYIITKSLTNEDWRGMEDTDDWCL